MEIFQMKEAYLMRKVFYQGHSSSCTMGVLEVSAPRKEQNYKNDSSVPTGSLPHPLPKLWTKGWRNVVGGQGTVPEGPQQGQVPVEQTPQKMDKYLKAISPLFYNLNLYYSECILLWFRLYVFGLT